MFQTKEVARNPTPEVKVRCISCKQEYSIVTSLKEIPVEAEEVGVVEGALVCPFCRHKKHVYFMTEILRHRQRVLNRCALEWQSSQTSDNYRKLVNSQRSYQRLYDQVQEKYKKELKNGSDKK